MRRIVAASLVAWLLGQAASPLYALVEQEVHACGCVGVCVCPHGELDEPACARHASPDGASLERCRDREDPVTPWQTTAEDVFVLRLPPRPAELLHASSFHILSMVSSPDEPPPRARA